MEKTTYFFTGVSVLFFILFADQLWIRKLELTRDYKMKLLIRSKYSLLACFAFAILALHKTQEAVCVLIIVSIYTWNLLCENRKDLKEIEKEMEKYASKSKRS